MVLDASADSPLLRGESSDSPLLLRGEYWGRVFSISASFLVTRERSRGEVATRIFFTSSTFGVYRLPSIFLVSDV